MSMRNQQGHRGPPYWKYLKINAWLDTCSLFFFTSHQTGTSWTDLKKNIFRPIKNVFFWGEKATHALHNQTCPCYILQHHLYIYIYTFIILIQCLLCVQVLAHRNSYCTDLVFIRTWQQNRTEPSSVLHLRTVATVCQSGQPWAAIVWHGSSFSCAMHEAHLKMKIKRMRYVSDSPMICLCRSANPHTDSLQLPVSIPLNVPEIHQNIYHHLPMYSKASERVPPLPQFLQQPGQSPVHALRIKRTASSQGKMGKYTITVTDWVWVGHGMGKFGKGQTVWQHETLNTILSRSFQLETDGWRI